MRVILVLLGLALPALAGAGLRGKKPPVRFDRLVVLAVGVDNYEARVGQLQFCADDARAIAAALTAKSEKPAFRETKVRLLLDKQATRKGILAALHEMASQVRRDDVFVFFFSGHGQDIGGKLSIMPQDFRMGKAATVIDHRQLGAALSLIPARCQLVLLDAFGSEAGLVGMMREITAEDRKLGALLERRRLIIGPAGPSYTSVKLRQGMVTAGLLRCLAPAGDLDRNGEITAWELESSVPAVVYQLSAAYNFKRLRVRSTMIGEDFPLVTVGKPKTRGLERGDTTKPAETEKPKPRSRRDYALLLASNEFDHWGTLSNPIPDARALKKDLEEDYGFTVELLENPTYAAMYEAFLKYKKMQYGPDDQLLVFFAGHGSYNTDTKQGYIISRDSTKTGKVPPARAFSHAAVRDMLDDFPCEHVMVVLDVCFGGTFVDPVSRVGSRGEGIYAELKREEAIRRQLKYRSRFYLASGGEEYVPDGRPGRHSPFAARLLDGLRGGAVKDGIVSFQTLSAHLKTLKIEPRGNSFGTSKPGATFLFVRKR